MAPAPSALARARRGAVAALLGTQVASADGATVCRPTDCFDGSCDGLPVTFASRNLTLSAWTGTEYSEVGNMSGYAAVEDDFGIFLHGPLFRPAQRKANDDLPALFVTGSLTDKIFKFTDFRHVGDVITASMKFVAWSPGPSTIWPIPPDHEGGPERLLIAEGNPFVVNPGINTTQMWRGGVDLIDQDKCTTIFPKNPLMEMFGRVVNTVECHPSGFCFFSVWKFYDDTMPMMLDDCLWYCRTNNANDPSSCQEVGVVEDELGNKICHQKEFGGVHGFKIGKDDPQDTNKFDMFLMYTGKGTFDYGDSEIYKIQLQVSFDGKLGGQSPYVKTLTRVPWGTDLWQKTLQKPHDVGVDHAWVDDDGKYVWVGTFRNHNDGVHMLEYDTGKLIHSVHGVADIIPGKYGYTSGVSGIGAYGKPGSYLAIATCQEFGQQIMGGHSAMVLLDISKPPVNGKLSTIVI